MKGFLPPSRTAAFWSVGIALQDPAALAEAAEAVRELSLRVAFALPTADPQQVLAAVETTWPNILVLAIESAGASLLADIKRVTAALHLIGVATETAPETIVRGLGLGFHDLAFPPLAPRLAEALGRAREQLYERAERGSGPRGTVIGFLSAKGGCGATTLACHIAPELGRLGRQKTLLMDLDVAAPLVGFLVAAESHYSLFEALANTHRLDASFWGALVARRENLDILTMPGPTCVDQLPPPEAIAATFRFLRSQYRWVVADLGRSLTRFSAALVEHLDWLLLVSTMERPAAEQARRLAGYFETARNLRAPLRLVLNRVPRRPAVRPPWFGGTPPLFEIVSDYRELYDAVRDSRLVPRRSRLGKEFTRAAKVLGESAVVGERRYEVAC